MTWRLKLTKKTLPEIEEEVYAAQIPQWVKNFISEGLAVLPKAVVVSVEVHGHLSDEDDTTTARIEVDVVAAEG